MSVWDDPDLRTGGEYVKLENKGDKIGGTIVAVRAHRFDGGDVAPQVVYLDKVGGTGDEKTWTAGQIQAKRKLAELRPEPGDDFTAELVDIERRAGGKTLKHIEINVVRSATAGPQAVSDVMPEVVDRLKRAHASSPVLNRGRGLEETAPF